MLMNHSSTVFLRKQFNRPHHRRIPLRRILEDDPTRRITDWQRQDQSLRKTLLRVGVHAELPHPEQSHLLLLRRGPNLCSLRKVEGYQVITDWLLS